MNESNTSKKCGSKEHIKGICCNVKNCVHHDCDTYCTAEEVPVALQQVPKQCALPLRKESK